MRILHIFKVMLLKVRDRLKPEILDLLLNVVKVRSLCISIFHHLSWSPTWLLLTFALSECAKLVSRFLIYYIFPLVHHANSPAGIVWYYICERRIRDLHIRKDIHCLPTCGVRGLLITGLLLLIIDILIDLLVIRISLRSILCPCVIGSWKITSLIS